MRRSIKNRIRNLSERFIGKIAMLYESLSIHPKFKVGDQVRYNWKAHIALGKIPKEKVGGEVIACYRYDGNKGDYQVKFKHGDYVDSSNAFWFRKAYFWEK